MAEMLVLWMLGLIVIAIAWGGIDKLAVPIRAVAQALQAPVPSKALESGAASLLALAVFSIMLSTMGNEVDDMAGWVSLPTILVWAGGIWLIPFRFPAVGHYWPFSLALAVILVLLSVGYTSHAPTHTPTHAQTHMELSTQQGQDASTRVSGRGFLIWIFLLGLTVAVISRYIATWNPAVYMS